jgi:hypothetical protein
MISLTGTQELINILHEVGKLFVIETDAYCKLASEKEKKQYVELQDDVTATVKCNGYS